MPAQLVSAGYFELLGIGAARGRVFDPGEGEPVGAHPVAVAKPVGRTNLPGGVRPDFVRAAGLGGVVGGAILLIACANVVNLLLVRAAGRRAEIASRLALGATPRRLLLQLLTEGALLGVLGGAAGLLLGWWGRGALWALRPPLLEQSAPDLTFDARVVGFALVVTGLTCAALGLVPALWVRRTDLASALRSRHDTHGGGRGRSFRSAVVGAQVALSVIAVVGCGQFLSALGRAQRIDPGFAADRLAVVTVNLGAGGYDPVSGQEFFRRALETVGASPRVASAAWSANLPLVPIGILMRTVAPEGEPLAGDRQELLTGVDSVSPGYFATAGVPLARGRAFAASDRADSPAVAIVNETLAARLWQGRDPVGERFRFHGETAARTVVGVARDAKYQTLDEEPTPYLYLPLFQEYTDRATLYLRSAQGEPESLLPAVRRQLQDLDPSLPLIGATTMADVLARSLWAPRLAAILLGLSATLAMVLTGVGLFGVAAFSAAQRHREIGIRLALGGDRGRVVRQLVAQGLRPVVVGLFAGILGAFLLTRAIAGLLYGVGAGDPVAYAGALLLVVVGLVANLLPARRAAALAPASVLRDE